jgi:hypothetical protein
MRKSRETRLTMKDVCLLSLVDLMVYHPQTAVNPEKINVYIRMKFP